MYKPEKYVKCGGIAKDMINYVIRNHQTFLTSKSYCNILDVGCGPGDCAHDLLLPLFSKSLKSYVGIDVSRVMVEYAKTHYKNSKLKFELLNILTDHLPANFEKRFDLVLSFQCLQLVGDHGKAFKNMYDLIKPGGEIFVSFVGRVNVFDVYKELAHTDEWRPYLKNYKQSVTSTAFSKTALTNLETNLQTIGFSRVKCEEIEGNFVYSKNTFSEFIESICTFPVPEDWMESYTTAVFEKMAKRKSVYNNDQGETFVSISYTLIVAYAAKINVSL